MNTKDLEAALEWYAEQVNGCRKLGENGNIARAKLDRDGGHKAVQALAAYREATT